MSIAEHLDSLQVYQAMAIRIVPVEGEPEDMLGEGGGLESAFERVGQRPLLGVLRDSRVQAVLLADGELTVEVERTGSGARFRVRWDGATAVDEPVEVPAAEPVEVGPLFRPDPDAEVNDLVAALHDVGKQLYAVSDVGGRLRWFSAGLHGRGAGQVRLEATVPAIEPAALGSAAFRRAHGVRWAYVAGAMAGGIGSADLVIAMARAGLLGFFGSGGLPLDAVEQALQQIAAAVAPGDAWGVNLLHNPVEPEVEERSVDLYLRHGVQRVSASAYMRITQAVLRFRLHGIHAGDDGVIVCPNQVFAKVSRPEVAEQFLRPAPIASIQALVEQGALTEAQAVLAAQVPVAEDVTAEADSGGHTDRRPLVVLLPILQELRDRIAAEEGYAARGIHPRIGAAGGLGTPAAVWAAFAMGADYVLTGSVNQAAVEAGTSPLAKAMLGEATFTDVATGPAPDMFELGAHVQVLSRGTMYARRAQRLYDLYRTYDALEDIPDSDRSRIEKQIFRRSLDEVWDATRAYWEGRDPDQLARAGRDPHHKMALAFRWYLGLTSRWARIGDEDRKRDFQMWCGPAMGAFNTWAAGSALADVGDRSVVGIASALMLGAAAHARIAIARSQGLGLPPGVDRVRPG